MAASDEIDLSTQLLRQVPSFTDIEWNGLIESLSSIYRQEDRGYRNFLGWFVPLTFREARQSSTGELIIQLSCRSAMQLNMVSKKILPQAEKDLSDLLDCPVHLELTQNPNGGQAGASAPLPTVQTTPLPVEHPQQQSVVQFPVPAAPILAETPDILPPNPIHDRENSIYAKGPRVDGLTLPKIVPEGENPSPTLTESPPDVWIPLPELIVAPEYATYYDEVVSANSAIYLPAYMIRHIRHMDPSDGLRYLALRQIAYMRGFNSFGGSQMVQTTKKELSRWSTLQPRSLPGNLDNPGSYLSLLASHIPYSQFYQQLPKDKRWEDADGYHWRLFDREYVLWKANLTSQRETCSQVFTNKVTGERIYKSSPLVYRVMLSTPLTPEDEESLKQRLLAFGIKTDPLEAMRKVLSLPREEIIPDRPQKLAQRPQKLSTVQEVVVETWGGSAPEVKSQLFAQAKVLEAFLINPEKDLFKIPHYLLRGYGSRLTPAQLWTLIVLQDRVYSNRSNGSYRDTTTIRSGYKEMCLWTNDEYKKTITRKIGRWLDPYIANKKFDEENDTSTNPWFSLFVNKVKSENGKAKNPDQSCPLTLRVLPLVPLTPEDTLRFINKMGVQRLLVRDASGQCINLEIGADVLAVNVDNHRSWAYSLSGELLSCSDNAPLSIHFQDGSLKGTSVLAANEPPGALNCSLDNLAGAHSCALTDPAGALNFSLDRNTGALNFALENQPGAHYYTLTFQSGALYCILLKLIILNLYGFNQNSYEDKTPSIQTPGAQIDSLEQFGSRAGQYIRWMADTSLQDWTIKFLCQALRISSPVKNSLVEKNFPPQNMLAWYMQLLTVPRTKFNSSREHVLISRLQTNPDETPGGAFDRVARYDPARFQSLLRMSIVNPHGYAVQDSDWNEVAGEIQRDELISLAEKLGLGEIIQLDDDDLDSLG